MEPLVVEPPSGGRPFEVQAIEVLSRLRVGFLGLLEALPGPIRRAADLERALGISTTLAWQVHRVATVPNPLAAGADVPGTAAAKQVLKAARSKGVSAERLRTVAEAIEAFESLVDRHAGDRATFTTMINNVVGRGPDAIDLKTRRQAFRVNSQVWGVQVKTILACTLHRPGKLPSLLDSVSIRGHRDIRCLRPGASMRVAGHRAADGKDAARQITELQSFGREAPGKPLGPTLLVDYCTQPVPELEHRLEDEFVATYLREMPLGNVGMQTLYLADMSCDIEWAKPGDSPNYFDINAAIRKPAEALVLDTLVQKNMFGELAPVVKVYASLDRPGVSDPHDFREDEVLPMYAEIHKLGTGLAVLSTPHVLRYVEMVESVCRRVGWEPEAFEVFRCIVDYPLLGSVVNVRFALPEKGNW